MKLQKSVYKKRNPLLGLGISMSVVAILVSGGFFVSRTLMEQNNIAETQTSASNVSERVNYAPGEFLVSFSSPPANTFESELQDATQLFDLKVKQRLNDTTYLIESVTLRNNAMVGINSNNLVDSKWGKLDFGTHRILTTLNENPEEVNNLEFAEPNYTVQTFTE